MLENPKDLFAKRKLYVFCSSDELGGRCSFLFILQEMEKAAFVTSRKALNLVFSFHGN